MSPIERSAGGGGGGSTRGLELDYAEKSSNTTSNSAVPVVVITGAAVSYDGATRIKLEFWAQSIFLQTNATGGTISLFEGVTEIGSLTGMFLNTGSTVSQSNANAYGARFFTPAAGTHTYSVKVYRDTGTGNVGVQAGAGGADTAFPCWYRITIA